jgi:Asp-tRNA(Asn)/Glu-tRNA(Gln) amidotransferase C subunit
MKLTFKKKISYDLMIGSFILVGISMPLTTKAVTTDYTPLAPLPCIPSLGTRNANNEIIPGSAVICGQGSAGSLQTTVDVKTYIQYAFNLLIALAAVVAVLMIVMGGFEYMTSDAVSGKEEGRKKMTNAIYGLLLVLCSFLILRTINPAFVQVPVGLVTPLGLKSENMANNWLNQVQSLANKYAVMTTADQKNLTDTRDAANKIDQQINDITKFLDETQNLDPTARQQMISDRNNLMQEKNDLQNQSVLYSARKSYDSMVQTGMATIQDLAANAGSVTSNMGSLRAANIAMANLKTSLTDATTEWSGVIKNYGDDPGYQQELKNQAILAQAKIQIIDDIVTLYNNPSYVTPAGTPMKIDADTALYMQKLKGTGLESDLSTFRDSFKKK